MAAHAISLIDSYIYGFVLQDVNLPFDDSSELEEVVEEILPLVLDGWRRRRAASRTSFPG